MLAKGDNNFKLPHLKKATAAGRGVSIPMELPCSQEAWSRRRLNRLSHLNFQDQLLYQYE